MLIQNGNDVSALIRSARKRKNLSQSELASLSNTTQVTISNIERGVEPYLSTLLRVMAILDIQLTATYREPNSNNDKDFW